MYDDPMNDRQAIAARQRARKKARRADKARRSAAIEDAWLRHMGVLTPAEEAAEAEQCKAETAAEQAAAEWPDDLPRPGEGRRFPSPRAIAKWLGVPVRKYDPHEITSLVTAWATAAREAGIEVNVSTAHGRTLPRSLGRPERPSRPATGRAS